MHLPNDLPEAPPVLKPCARCAQPIVGAPMVAWFHELCLACFTAYADELPTSGEFEKRAAEADIDHRVPTWDGRDFYVVLKPGVYERLATAWTAEWVKRGVRRGAA